MFIKFIYFNSTMSFSAYRLRQQLIWPRRPLSPQETAFGPPFASSKAPQPSQLSWSDDSETRYTHASKVNATQTTSGHGRSTEPVGKWKILWGSTTGKIVMVLPENIYLKNFYFTWSKFLHELLILYNNYSFLFIYIYFFLSIYKWVFYFKKLTVL